MDKRFLIFFIIVIISLLNPACSLYKESAGKGKSNANFAIYMVEGLKTSEVLEKDINDLDLEDEPILTDRNILEYSWETHKITLLNDEEHKKSLDERIYLKVPVDGKPFVVVCNGELIYVGTFWTQISSIWPRCPIIVSDFKDKDSFQISYTFAKGDKKKDKRNDKRVYETLKQLGKLK